MDACTEVTKYIALTYIYKRNVNGNRYRKTILLNIDNKKYVELPMYNYTINEVSGKISDGPYEIIRNVTINTDKSKRALEKVDFYTIL